jgi:hypothetical protein
MVYRVDRLNISENRTETSYKQKPHTMYSQRDSDQSFSKLPCNFCQGNHGVSRFQDLCLQDRWQVVKDKGLCFQCLGGTIKEAITKKVKNVEQMAENASRSTS